MKKLGLIASLLAGLGSLGLGTLYLQRLEAEIGGGPKVAVLVAAKDVPVGAALSESLLAVRDIPQAYVEGRHVRAGDVKKVLGARIAGGLKANETLLWSDLSKFSDQTRVLSGLVQHGMRAVAIDGRSADFEGLLRPGDRVDVLFTGGSKAEGAGATTTLLQNLLVLSVGSNIARNDEETSRGHGRAGAVTLSASVEQAQLLTQAQQRGRLTLTLRNTDDITIVQGVPEATAASLLGAAAPAAERQPTKTSAGKGGIDHVR
jgi:pilus assembly protein CpaB